MPLRGSLTWLDVREADIDRPIDIEGDVNGFAEASDEGLRDMDKVEASLPSRVLIGAVGRGERSAEERLDSEMGSCCSGD